MDLHGVLYMSAFARLPTAADLDAILTVSERNNAADDITGVLLHHDGSVLQLLEGPREAVRRRYDAIARDPRHGGVMRLFDDSLARRSFPDWRMALTGLDKLSPDQARAFADLHAFRREADAPDAFENPVIATLVRRFLANLPDLSARI